MKKILLLSIYLLASGIYAQECVDRIDCSDNNVTVFLEDGTIYTWGLNNFGQLGNGLTSSLVSPMPTVNASQWADVRHARMHTIATDHDGKLWAWGNNALGQLGNNSTEPYSYVPAESGTGSEWSAISAGNLHSVGLKSDGTLWGWGNNGAYELIMNGESFYSVPFQMSPDTDWYKIYAGYFKTFAIKTDGTLWGRGRNNFGDIGIGSQNWVPHFTQIGTASNWSKISAARNHVTLGLRADNTLWVWGNNENGRLGDGTTTNRYAPVQLAGEWKDVASGNFHSLGIKMDGTLWQWGSYGYFEGGFLIPNSTVPVQVGTDTDWKSVAAGYCSSYAIKENKSLWAWGYNGGGWLGDGTTTSRANPVMIMGCTELSVADEALHEVVAYPNPAREILSWNGSGQTESFQIVNALGQVVKSGRAFNSVSLAELSQGVYLLILNGDNAPVRKTKFVKR